MIRRCVCQFMSFGLGINGKVVFFLSRPTVVFFFSRTSKLAERSTSFRGGGKYTLEAHKGSSFIPKRLCYEFSTLPGYVFGVHVILVLSCWMLHWRAYLWEYCQNVHLVHVWMETRKEASLMAQADLRRENLCLFFLLWPRTVATEQFEILWVIVNFNVR